MKSWINCTASLVVTTFLPIFCFASGPTEITTSQLRNDGSNKVKFCFKSYSGWGESEWTCSRSVAKDDKSLESLKGLLSKNPKPVIYDIQSGLETRIPQGGFAISELYNSIAINNCDLTQEALNRKSKLADQIEQLRKESSAISMDSSNRTCEKSAETKGKGETSVPESFN